MAAGGVHPQGRFRQRNTEAALVMSKRVDQGRTGSGAKHVVTGAVIAFTVPGDNTASPCGAGSAVEL